MSNTRTQQDASGDLTGGRDLTRGGDLRVRVLRDEPERSDGDFVVYWMTATRRLEWNFALDRAVARARALDRPLIVLEGLRAGYRWASDRHHAFVLAGMEEHARRLEGSPVAYLPYVEPEPGAGRGLLEALAKRACLVVTDDAPVFFLPRMLAAAADRIGGRLEAVDSCGLLPLAEVEKPYVSAYHFRRFLQKRLGEHLTRLPDPDPLGLRCAPDAPKAGAAKAGAAKAGAAKAGAARAEGAAPERARPPLPPAVVPEAILSRWPAADGALLARERSALAALPIDHEVVPSPLNGGTTEARARLDAFLTHRLSRYGNERNEPDAAAASGLSPWLHFGHLSVHEVFHRVAVREGWSPTRLGADATGKRHGWWGMSTSAEAFLDELVTWRELGFGFCRVVPGYERYETLPDWALETLAEHADDERPWLYALEDFEAAATHDELWNAAQRQLRDEGVIHNYLRMLWGKKILEWSASPREALDIMVELNNRYAIDGRDPNSYTGIMWILGRFDRGWPERPVFGKVRSMSSDATRRKVSLERYLERWGGQPELFTTPATS